ncbi:MAG: leucine-rich repeat domain-containing protein [Bacteroidales bacterium]|nr:leucine-rich repeat domain-containing protein [Bacteroidales bacterium]
MIEGYDGYYNGYFVVYESVFKDCPITNLYLGRKFYCPGSYNPPFKGMNTLETVTIGNGVTAIEDVEDYAAGGVFLDCINLTDVIIGDGIQAIYPATFKDCKKLKNVTIGNNVEAIYTGAFMGCTSLTNITIPQSVNLIGDLVFKNTGLISITIPRYVRIIGEDVFSSALSSIYLMNKSPFAIPDEKCFTNYHYVNTTLYVPVGSIEKYKQAVVWKNFWNIQECDNIGIDDIDESSISLEVMRGGIRLIGAERIPIAIYTINGILVEKIDKYTGEDIFLDKGIYIVSVGNKTMKIKL